MRTLALIAGLVSLAHCTKRNTLISGVDLFPANGAKDVNPDTHLVLTFPSSPVIGSSGNVTVYDLEDGRLVDTLDLSIPSSPSPYGNGSTKANYSDSTTYQSNIIGGIDFYFYPIIVRDNVATIYLHNNRLDYNRTYSVTIGPAVLKSSDYSFNGITHNSSWTFTTKSRGPAPGVKEVTVAADGSADFNTVQGAIDWAPSNSLAKTTIHIKEGNYEELVYFQYKSNLVIRGQSRNKTIVGYPNNSAFNPPNRQGPSRRSAFSFKGVADLQISGFTITNYYRGQAEALLIDGIRVIVDRMNLNGSGDALTTYGTAYIADTTLWGDGDTILGYGSVFWKNSTVITRAGPVSWTRTGQGVHGNVMLNCTIIGGQGNSTFARLPDNKGGVQANWPYAEMVLLNTKTGGIALEGWGPVQGPPFDTFHLHLWEYNTMGLDGKAVDYSHRVNVSRQLTSPRDDSVVEKYSDPAFVLGGWTPVVS
ncbi:carbohydrate esterase family 8 protein [Cucurbitaria berberidis CBS 394.84]|uniref:pectinesterase n=1 Tax=Cucurbitaria berberidis CBS 394.84 TaxID=1168544 RepID=A0A9P4GCT9_9PLEO|nr:carbohydrate esterase family 8 protein [Cucurbitaria berberidis CBS 394.84]KAF1842845.1 carbohydrate esterase family 8 protein [Cucurbitaria berberidis CBS 394.84]